MGGAEAESRWGGPEGRDLGARPASEPRQPAERLGTRPLPGASSARPRGRPEDSEAAVLGTRQAALPGRVPWLRHQ